MNPQFDSIGESIQAQPSVFPQSTSGATVINGASVNRQASNNSNANSCVLTGRTGASTGSPTSYTATFKIQHSADDKTFVDFVDQFGNGSGEGALVLTGDNQSGHVNIDLSGANQFVRVVETPAFTGGSSPSTPVSGDIVLGGFDGSTAVPVADYD